MPRGLEIAIGAVKRLETTKASRPRGAVDRRDRRFQLGTYRGGDSFVLLTDEDMKKLHELAAKVGLPPSPRLTDRFRQVAVRFSRSTCPCPF